MKKKIIASLLCLTMVFSMTACGGKNSDSDVDYIKDKGTLVVGITDFEPMDYKDDSGEWVGFDADMAKMVGESLGVDVEFVEIDWDNKIMELKSKNIDVVWNGMTLTDEVKNSMECTNAYCSNGQVIVTTDESKLDDPDKDLNQIAERFPSVGTSDTKNQSCRQCKYQRQYKDLKCGPQTFC